jgi:hypothetical protein
VSRRSTGSRSGQPSNRGGGDVRVRGSPLVGDLPEQAHQDLAVQVRHPLQEPVTHPRGGRGGGHHGGPPVRREQDDVAPLVRRITGELDQAPGRQAVQDVAGRRLVDRHLVTDLLLRTAGVAPGRQQHAVLNRGQGRRDGLDPQPLVCLLAAPEQVADTLELICRHERRPYPSRRLLRRFQHAAGQVRASVVADEADHLPRVRRTSLRPHEARLERPETATGGEGRGENPWGVRIKVLICYQWLTIGDGD